MYYWNWLRMKTFSNIAGTLSDSFKIGKGGIEILQGTEVPTGNIAPVGSVYIRTLNGSTGIYQHETEGTWVKLFSPSSYRQSFVNEDLNSDQILITHNLNEQFVTVTVYKDNSQAVSTEQIEVYATSANTTLINLTALTPISGTWNIVITR